MSSTPPTAAYTLSLPKLELHAHLTGSITPQTLHEIWLHPTLSPTSTLEDPLHALAPTKEWSITTFFPLFSTYIYALICTPESVTYATNAILQNFMADGVVYLELRTTPRESEFMSKEGYVQTVLECIAAFKGKGMSTFLILSIDRGDSAEVAMGVVELACKYRGRGVVGVDLCGDPRRGDVGVFGAAFERARGEGLGITLHFAEVEASAGREEVETLLGWRPGRLGHVVHVEKEVRRKVLGRGVGVELCVSCNVQAGLTEGGVGGHHFGWWWEHGGRIILCVSHPSTRCLSRSDVRLSWTSQLIFSVLCADG